MSHEYARRQAWAKRKKEPVDPKTDKEEWENEFDREEMYEKPFP
jgi:hypothetical protein